MGKLSTNTFGVAKWVVSPDVTQGTHTTITSAMASAASGDTIWVRDGTYTENFSIKPGINLVAAPISYETATCTINGTLTMTGAGTATVYGIDFTTNSAPCVVVSGANNCQLVMEDVYFGISNANGINFTNTNNSSKIFVTNMDGDISANGFTLYNVSGAGTINFYNSFCSNSGGSTTASNTGSATISGGAYIYNCNFFFAITDSSPLGNRIYNSTIECKNISTVPFTYAGTGTGYISNCSIFANTQSAIIVNSGSFIISNSLIDSGNTNALSGTGAIGGGGLVFPDSTGINVTTFLSVPLFPELSPSSYVVSPTKGLGNYTTITAAMAAAPAGQTVFVKDGIYTENFTITPGVDLCALQSSYETPTVQIIGTMTMSGAGTCTVTGIAFQTNSAPCVTVSGTASCQLVMEDCYFGCTNNTGISFTNSNSASNIFLTNIDADIGTTGITLYSSSSPGVIKMYGANCTNSGNTVTPSNNSAGGAVIYYSTLQIPLSTTSNGYFQIYNSTISASSAVIPLNAAGNQPSGVSNSYIFAGTAVACITIGGAARVTVALNVLATTAVNAMTGSGIVNTGGNVCTGGAGNTVTTQNHLTII